MLLDILCSKFFMKVVQSIEEKNHCWYNWDQEQTSPFLMHCHGNWGSGGGLGGSFKVVQRTLPIMLRPESKGSSSYLGLRRKGGETEQGVRLQSQYAYTPLG